MSGNRIKVDQLAATVMKELEDYADLATTDMKGAVRKAGNTVRNEIKSGAPSRTGKYAASWTVKTERETSQSLELVVHSRNRYQLAHLLEFGHAKRGGGRVAARPHIASAEQKGIEELEHAIERSLSHG